MAAATSACSPFPGDVVTEDQGAVGTGDQDAGVGVVADGGPPRGHPQDLVGGQRRLVTPGVGELAPAVVDPPGRGVVQEHVAEQRVGESQLEAALDPAHLDDPPAFEAPQHVAGHEAVHHGAGQRLAEGHELEGVALGLVEATEALGDEVAEPHAGAQRAVPPPDPGLLDQCAGRQPLVDQLTQEQGVAAGDIEQPAGGRPVDGPAQGGGEQFAHLEPRQRLDLDAHRMLVLPQRDDRIGRRLAAADRHHDPRRAGGHQQVDQGGRGVVEQVRVVDPHDRPALRRMMRDGADDGVEDDGTPVLPLTDGKGLAGHEVSERPQGHRGRGPCRRHPLGRRPPGTGRQDLTRQARLADPGRAGEDHAAVSAQRLLRQGQLVAAPHQRP
jgi:hypothetical protein